MSLFFFLFLILVFSSNLFFSFASSIHQIKLIFIDHLLFFNDPKKYLEYVLQADQDVLRKLIPKCLKQWFALFLQCHTLKIELSWINYEAQAMFCRKCIFYTSKWTHIRWYNRQDLSQLPKSIDRLRACCMEIAILWEF